MSQSDYFDSLEAAIIIGHKCQAVHRATIFVHEKTEYGLTIWKGNVEVFDLKTQPTAKICYTWRCDDRDRSKIFTMLGNELIDSARKAIQAMLCLDQQPIKSTPLSDGSELFRQQIKQAKKIIHQIEIRAEELVIPVDMTAKNHQEIIQRHSGTNHQIESSRHF